MSAIVKVNIENLKHKFRVADYSIKIAKELNLFQDDIDELRLAALAHELENMQSISQTLQYKDEWFDGSGKEGVTSGMIPLLSRIFAIAHFYDELIQKMSNIEASKILHKQAYTRFDPILIPVAIKALEERQ